MLYEADAPFNDTIKISIIYVHMNDTFYINST